MIFLNSPVQLDMKNLSVNLFILFSLLFSASVFAQEKGVVNTPISKLPAKEKRWALIVGVNNFGLKGAVNDAKALKNALVKFAGFPENQIVLLTTDDANNPPYRRNILIELDKLSRSVPTDGLFLFAFSGHGITVSDNAYLIPSDGQLTNNNKLLRDISIDVKSVKEAIEEMKVKQVLMVIDACRDRIEGKGKVSEPLTSAVARGFSFDETNKDVEAFVTLYATRLGEFAYEYLERETNQYRGYFSRALEEGLSGKAANEKGEVTLAGLMKYVEDTVPARSYRNENKRQIPWKNTNNGYKENELILAIAGKSSQPPNLNPNGNVVIQTQTVLPQSNPQISSFRFDGIYQCPGTTDSSYFRFYTDGNVEYAKEQTTDVDYVMNNWKREFSKAGYFNKEKSRLILEDSSIKFFLNLRNPYTSNKNFTLVTVVAIPNSDNLEFSTKYNYFQNCHFFKSRNNKF